MLALLAALSLALPSDSPAAVGPVAESSAVKTDSVITARSPDPMPASDSPAASAPDSGTAKQTASPAEAKPPIAPKTASPIVPGPVGPVGPIGPVGPVGPVVVPPPTATLTYGPTGAIVKIDTSKTNGPSTASLVGLSLLLPGLGHTASGHGGALSYHSIDLLGWAALFVSWQTGKAAMSSLAEIANRYAGASLGSDPDPELISAIRSYRSRRPVAGRHGSYDENSLLSGKSTTWQFSDDAAHDWDWGSAENSENDAHLRAFESQYRRWRASQVALYASAGGIVLLRVVAAMDILRLERASAARAGISMDIGPQVGGVDARLAWKF